MAISRYIADAVPGSRQSLPGFRSGAAPAPTPQFNSGIINSAVPGGSQLSQSASNIVGNLLSGLPGTSLARKSNAYFGTASGMPSSDFVRNRGFDLYNQQGEERQQRGIQDLLAMLSGFSQPILQERGQAIQSSQFGQNLAEQQRQFDLDYYLKQKNLRDKNFKGAQFAPAYGGTFTGGNVPVTTRIV